MIWARWAGVMGVPMKWEIARIFVVGTGGSGFCAEAAPSGVFGFFMAVAPDSSFDILPLADPYVEERAFAPVQGHPHSCRSRDGPQRQTPTAAIVMAIFATAIATSMLLIASHTRPFTGAISVGPDALQQVMPQAP